MAQNQKSTVNKHFLLKILNRLMFRPTQKRNQRQIWFCLFFEYTRCTVKLRSLKLRYFLRAQLNCTLSVHHTRTTLINVLHPNVLHGLQKIPLNYWIQNLRKFEFKNFGQVWTKVNNILYQFIYHTHYSPHSPIKFRQMWM